QAFGESLKFRRHGIMQKGEALGRKMRDFLIRNRWIFRERIADRKIRVSHESDDVAGPRLVYNFPLPPKQLMRIGKPQAPAGPLMQRAHVPDKMSGADSHKRHAVAVAGVHVGLNLKNKTRKSRMIRFDEAVSRAMGSGWARKGQEAFE